MPTLHTQLSLPAGDEAPGGQGAQDGLPGLDEYEPMGHAVHFALAVCLPKKPGSQMQKLLPIGAVALRHGTQAATPCGEKVLAGHKVQTDAPVTSEYLPLGQAGHGVDETLSL